jgi:8-oxo-dGTP pyrophosphatase MutT (NUDIX family)
MLRNMSRLWRWTGIAAFWASWPLLWIYLLNTRRTRLIIFSGNKKVLLVKGWLGAGQWGLPGGGVHKGESPVQAAIREVKEETGIVLDPEALEFVHELRIKEYGLQCRAGIYVVQLKDEPKVTPQRWEITEVKWLAADELSHLGPLTKQLLADWS